MASVAERVERFNGFPDGAIAFLLELQAEQNRTWFKAHQDDFVRLCRRPLELFILELRERLADVYPGMLDVEPHLFRIQRDTRFARDTAPYKTNVAANLAIRAPADGEPAQRIPGVYVSFGLDGELVGIGTWHMPPEVLRCFRAMLADDRRGAEFQGVVDHLLGQGYAIATIDKLKRVPPPFPADHPRGDLLKHKGLALVVRPTDDLSSSRAFLDWAEDRMRNAAPAAHLLDNALRTAAWS